MFSLPLKLKSLELLHRRPTTVQNERHPTKDFLMNRGDRFIEKTWDTVSLFGMDLQSSISRIKLTVRQGLMFGALTSEWRRFRYCHLISLMRPFCTIWTGTNDFGCHHSVVNQTTASSCRRWNNHEWQPDFAPARITKTRVLPERSENVQSQNFVQFQFPVLFLCCVWCTSLCF